MIATHLLIAVVLLIVPTACQQCPKGWLTYDGSDFCYQFNLNNVKKSWNEARQACMAIQGDLVSYATDTEKQWVQKQIRRFYQFDDNNSWQWWIGLNDLKTESTWEWSDGTTYNQNLISWGPSEPNNAGGDEDCAELDATKTANNINDNGCSNQFCYVCKRKKAIATHCPDGWDHIEGACFKLFDTAKSWNDASADCGTYGGHLAAGDTDIEQQYIVDKIKCQEKDKAVAAWVGIKSVPGTGGQRVSWQLDNGGAPTQQYWGTGKPLVQRGFENATCVEILSSAVIGKKAWTTRLCITERPYMCKKPEGVCARGWMMYNNTCYQLNANTPLSYYDADTYCKSQGGALLQIKSANTMQYIQSTIRPKIPVNSAFWIGISDIDNDGQFKWSDGQLVSQGYQNWGSASNTTGKSDCGQIFAGNRLGKWTLNDNCLQQQPFVCQISSKLVVHPPTVSPSGTCETGWEAYSFNCYYFNTSGSSWTEAQKLCQGMGANLVDIKGPREQSFIDSKTKTTSWIGLNDRQSEGDWVWPDRSQPTWTNWNTNEPNNAGSGEENCAEVIGDQGNQRGKWNDLSCNTHKRGYICKKAASETPVGQSTVTPGVQWSLKCGPFWVDNTLSDYCYRFNNEFLNWYDARHSCQVYGGELTSIQTVTEYNFITGQLSAGKANFGAAVWLGGNDLTTEGGWAWSDSSPFSFVYWNPGEPNQAGNEDCMTMNVLSGRWNDESCKTRRAYICRKKGLSSSTAPSVTTSTTPMPGQVATSCANGAPYECIEHLPRLADDFCRWGCDIRASEAFTKDSCHPPDHVLDGCCYDCFKSCKPCNKESDLYTIYDNMDCYGNDYDGMANSNISACRAKCTSEPYCAGFVFNRRSNYCYPKHTCTARTIYQRAVLYVKQDILRCQDGWKMFGNKCYKFVTTKADWATARQKCREGGSELVSIGSKDEHNYIFSQAALGTDKVYWTGLNDLQSSSAYQLYQWSDGSPVTFTKWNRGEPNNWNGKREDCVSVNGLESGWNDAICDLQLQYICKGVMIPRAPTAAPPTYPGCPTNSIGGYKTSCYIRGSSPKTWEQAEADCVRKGGHLLHVKDRFEQAYISSLVATVTRNDGDMLWIGLRRVRGAYYSWASGESILYTHWDISHDIYSRARYCVAMKTGFSAGLWFDKQCSDQRNYICETHQAGYSPTPDPRVTIPPNPRCPSSWRMYNGKCYKAIYSSRSKRTWSDARDFCRYFGGDLISYHNASEELWVTKNVLRSWYRLNFWIGLNSRGVNKGHVWSDGSAVSYENWNTNEPDNHNNQENCVEYEYGSKKWGDANCYMSKAFLCKADVNVTPPPSTTVQTATTAPQWCNGTNWLAYKDNCYYISPRYGSRGSSRNTWYGARSWCMQNNGDLASIHSKEEYGFLLSAISMTTHIKLWIGLNELDLGGYKWSDGTVTDFVVWAKNEPNDFNGGQKCVDMYTQSTGWNDDNCGDTIGFICKRHRSSTSPVTVPTTTLIPGYCHRGWVGAGNKCFKIFGTSGDNKLNWTSARDACDGMGQGYSLASVSNVRESAVLTMLLHGLKTDAWIGLSDVIKHNQFLWVDNSPFTFNSWERGEPNGPRSRTGYMPSNQHRHYGPLHIHERDMLQLPLLHLLSQDQIEGLFGDDCVSANHLTGQWADKLCGLELSYVCQQKKDGTVLNTPAPPAGNCQSGYKNFAGACFKLMSQERSWNDSLTACRNEGGDLASVLDPGEQAYVQLLMMDADLSAMWIGLYDQNKQGWYRWSDNWPVSYANWGAREPTRNPDDGCVAMMADGKWNSTVCSFQLPSVCVKRQGTPPQTPKVVPGSCPDTNWISSPASQYCFYYEDSVRRNWATAAQECFKKGGQLASITSERDTQDLITIFKSRSWRYRMWIGLIRKNDGSFTWSDGSPVSYVNWADGEPQTKSDSTYRQEECVEFNPATGLWRDMTCYTYMGFLCKTPKVVTTLPPTLPVIKIGTAAVASSPTPSTSPDTGPRTPGRRTQQPGVSVTYKQTGTQGPLVADTSLSIGAIAGITIGSVFVIAVIVIVGAFFLCRYRGPSDGSLFSFSNALYNKNNDTVCLKDNMQGNGILYSSSDNVSQKSEDPNPGFNNPIYAEAQPNTQMSGLPESKNNSHFLGNGLGISGEDDC